MLKPLLLGVNKKRLFATILGVFIYFFGTDFIIHQGILKESYQLTASLWRTEADMSHFFPYMLVGHLLIAAFFSCLFARGYEGRGLTEGLRFGLLIGPYSVAPCFIQYAVTPITEAIFVTWVVGGLLQALGGGLVAALIYKK